MSTTASIDATKCRWCGMIHGPHCPMLKAIECYADGTIKRVEFKSANDYTPPLPYTPMPPSPPLYPLPLPPWHNAFTFGKAT